MYQSKIPISKKTKQQNRNAIVNHLQNIDTSRCGVLRRRTYCGRYLEVNDKRQNAFIYYSSFFVGVDILQKATDYTSKWINGYLCYSIEGYAKAGEKVIVHLREEVNKKDKTLVLLSCFYKSK